MKKRDIVFIGVLFMVFMMAKIILKPVPFKIADNETASLFVSETIEELNRLVQDDLLHYKVYTAGFTENDKINHLLKANSRALLWIDGHTNLNAENLNNYGKIFVTTPYLKSILQPYYTKDDIYIIPRGLTTKELSLSTVPEDRQVAAVIGHPPYIENILKSKGIAYKKLTWEEADAMTQKEMPFSMIFADNWYYEKKDLDIPPVLLKALYFKIPLIGYWSGEYSMDPLYWFNDDANFYMFQEDAEVLINEILAKDKVIEKRKQHGRKLFDAYFSPYSAAKKIKSIIFDGGNTDVMPISPKSVRIDIPTMVGHYGAGDYWIARDIAETLEQKGYQVDISYINSTFIMPAETVFLLRGKNKVQDFYPSREKKIYYQLYINDINEVSDYILVMEKLTKNVDVMLTSSPLLYKEMVRRGNTLKYLPQFTNSTRFYPDYDETLKSEVLFIGNYHFYRRAAVAALQHGLPITIYGNFWPEGLAKKGYVDNRELRKYYSSAKIVLNDMLPGMKKAGFISNRIFDATASGALVISEYIPEIEEIYGDSVVTFKTTEEMVKLIKYYLSHDEERRQKAEKARQITLKNFTLDKLKDTFEDAIKEALSSPSANMGIKIEQK